MKPLQYRNAERTGFAEPVLSRRDVQGEGERSGQKPKRNRGGVARGPDFQTMAPGGWGANIQSRSFELGPKGNAYLYRDLIRRIGAAPES